MLSTDVQCQGCSFWCKGAQKEVNRRDGNAAVLSPQKMIFFFTVPLQQKATEAENLENQGEKKVKAVGGRSFFSLIFRDKKSILKRKLFLFKKQTPLFTNS